MLGMSGLPAGWSVRPPTLHDVPAILAVVHASDIAAVGEPDFTTDDVVEVLQGPNADPAKDSWLAIDGQGQVVGWAYIDNPTRGQRDVFDNYVHPEHGVAAHGHLLDLVVARIAERASEFGYPEMTARGGVIASEERYLGLPLATAFATYAAKGRWAAGLGVDLTNPTGAYRLYESVGMRPVYEADMCERTVRAA
jgi:mycothiol synthase